MRTTFFFAALLLVAALAALLVERHRSATTSAGATRGTATLVGDSLNVGVERYLPDCPAALEDRRQRPRRPHDRRGDRRARGRSAGPLLRTSSSASARTIPPDVPGFRADVARVLELIGPEPLRRSGRRSGATGSRTTRSTTSCATAAAANHRLRLVEWAAMVRGAPRLARRRRPARQRDGLS